MSNVYSYLRFSSPKQAAGSSASRQTDYAQKWAEENGMVLDDTLTMRDEGLSAYHQKHVKSGALGAFLEAVTAGRIPTGSVLIVEGLDRLSRAEPILAQAQLAQIVNANITVVTASDGKTYNRESLKANPMDLVYSLLVMVRAHEESETKSKRVKAAILRKCKAWEAGEKVLVPSGKDPSWVRRTGSKYELIPERAAAMREALRLYISGYGPVRIVQELNARGMTVVGERIAGNVDHLLTKQPQLFLGHRPMNVLGESFLLRDYYPALLDESEFAALSVEIASRKQKPHRAGGKSLYPPLFTGLGIGECGHCGNRVVSQNSYRTFKSGNTSVYRRVVCPHCDMAASRRGEKERLGSCGVKPLEIAIFDFCADQFNLSSLTAGGDASGALRGEQAAILGLIADLEAKIEKFTTAMLDSPDDVPQSMMRKIASMEKEVAQAKAREDQILAELRVTKDTGGVASAQAWSELREGALALDYDARMKARKLVEDTFSGVKVYFRGALPTTPTGAIDVLLVAKSGQARMLSVDRKSGRVVRAIEYLNQGAKA